MAELRLSVRAVPSAGPRASRGFLAVVATFSIVATLVVAPVSAGSGRSRPAAKSDACLGEMQISTSSGVACVHGDDAMFRRMAKRRSINSMPIPCRGDGKSGNRIAAYYAYVAGRANHVARARGQIRSAIEQANAIVYQSSRQTGGARWLRVLTNSRCQPIVRSIRLPRTAARNFGRTILAASAAGLRATNRKYLLFADAGAYCGIATIQHDDRPGPMNLNNSGASWARVDRGCWSGVVTAHEIFHMLGSVQAGAPHYDGTGHCTDDRDLMCYQNPGGKRVYIRCGPTIDELRLDCAKDDYFNTSPPPGSYLARHWDTARSSFLYGGGPARPRRPSGVRALHAVFESLNSARLHWRPPARGNATHYAVMKDGAIVWRGTTNEWTDHHATSTRGDYRVAARNARGSGPWSPAINAYLPRPAAPEAVVRVSSGTVRWTYHSPLAAGFLLYGLTSGGSARYLSRWPADARSATDRTLALFRSWNRYRVCAYNSAGSSCRDEPR